MTRVTAPVAVFCNGMSNFGARFADPCGWAGSSADAQYILDERRCPKCSGELRKAPPASVSSNLEAL